LIPLQVLPPLKVALQLRRNVIGYELDLGLKEVPKDVLAEVAPSEGISPISYGIVGIGVVLIVIAGVLFTRRKKA